MTPDALYTLAVQLPPSPERARLLEDIVREARWSAIVEAHRGELAGIEAGREMTKHSCEVTQWLEAIT